MASVYVPGGTPDFTSMTTFASSSTGALIRVMSKGDLATVGNRPIEVTKVTEESTERRRLGEVSLDMVVVLGILKSGWFRVLGGSNGVICRGVLKSGHIRVSFNVTLILSPCSTVSLSRVAAN